MGAMLGSAAINAIAFSGSSSLFKLFDKNGSINELKRHNLATENLNRASIEWSQHRKQVIDFVNLQMKKENDAEIDFRNVDSSLILYNHLHPEYKMVINKKPELKDFYVQSDKMNNYEYLFIILSVSGVGLIIYKFVV
jgi:hypothetical protein